MNGNITQDGIARDLAWMKEVGLGGVQMFDVGLQTPQIVEKRLTYMTPEWKQAFRFAAQEAERHGLEFTIASSPGWSETGGPWVPPEDAMKKLVWSEIAASGGQAVGALPPPPAITGPFQTQAYHDSFAAMEGHDLSTQPLLYRDVAVLAVPTAVPAALPAPVVSTSGAGMIEADGLLDTDLETGVHIAKGQDVFVEYDYGQPVRVRSAQAFLAGASQPFSGPSARMTLQAGDESGRWRDVADMPVGTVPATRSFAPVTASRFRLLLSPAEAERSNMGAPEAGALPPPFAAAMAATARQPHDLRHFKLSAAPRTDRFEAKAGFAVVEDYYALPALADDATGPTPGQVINLTGRLQPDGSLDWTPPEGDWTILRLGYSLLGSTNHPAAPEATGLEVDKYDAAAVRRYLETYLGMYADALGQDIAGSGLVDAILTDSLEAGAANWTPDMIAQFRRLRGYDLLPWLPALTGTIIKDRAATDRFLHDYRQTLADLLAEAHYGTVASVAHANGLAVYGEALEDNRPALGDDMAMRAHADYPMAAMWSFDRPQGPAGTYVADVKGAASVANLYGRKVVAAESMTSAMAYWADAPRHLKRVIDTEFVHGVNRPVIHTSVHQPVDDRKPGLSLAIFGQFFNRHESWAPLARPWIDYIARSSFLLQQGRHGADVAYFHGEEAPLTALFFDGPPKDTPIGHGFDFVNADALHDVLSVRDGRLVAPTGMEYRLLYLGRSSRMMTLSTLRRIASLLEDGAIVAGQRPIASPSLNDDQAAFDALAEKLWNEGGNASVIEAASADEALARLRIAPRLSWQGAKGADIGFLQRTMPDGEIFYLVNNRDRSETIEASFRVSGKAPQIWQPETGNVRPIGYAMADGRTDLTIDLDPGEALFVVFREDTSIVQKDIARPSYSQQGEISGPWHVAFQEGRGAPAAIGMDRLKLLNESDDAGIRYFSGIATYAADFETPAGWFPGQPLLLDLGEVHDIAEVRVNETMAGSAWHAPWQVDIGAVARPGRNSVQIRVANRWINRLIGDAQEDGTPDVTYTALPTYAPDAPLRPSGLAGPVTILTAN